MKKLILALLLLNTLPTRAADLRPAIFGDFATYKLALSWTPDFCRGKTAPPKSGEPTLPWPAQCLSGADDKRNLLTLHGLWPSLPASQASRMFGNTDQLGKDWRNLGCAAVSLAQFPAIPTTDKCTAPKVTLGPGLSKKDLYKAMSGANPVDCLDRYEWSKHGVCFGFVADDYFGTMVRLLGQVRGSRLGTLLAEKTGKPEGTTLAELQNAASEFAPADGTGIRFTCNGDNFTGIDLTIKSEAINQPLTPGVFAKDDAPAGCKDKVIIGDWNGF
jgi:ribonuclease I